MDYLTDLEEAYAGRAGIDHPTEEQLRKLRARIAQDSPLDRLGAFLEWNGILGYTQRIWRIAQGGVDD